MLDYAILGFLNEQPLTGYDLKTRCFDDLARPFWTADQAQIYRTLDRLEREALVTSRKRRRAGRPDRKVFEITRAGRESLALWLSTPLALPPARDAFLTQLYFSADIGDESLTAVLGGRRTAHQSRLDELRERGVELSRDESLTARDRVVKRLALDGAIATERCLIDWLDDTIETVGSGLPGSDDGGETQRTLFGFTPA